MAINKAMFSSNRDDWETPPELFWKLDAEFGFTMDVCATPQNAKCYWYWTKEDDALSKPWTGNGGVLWMNPPYGSEIGKWVKKAYEESKNGVTTVCLLPARTDTAWWHDYCMRGEVRFLRGRVKFVGAKSGAPFPSAIVIFRGKVVSR
jgi:phage N-6-adenine-methyltransferase